MLDSSSLTDCPTDSLTDSQTDSLIHPLTHPPAHSPTHSPTNPLARQVGSVLRPGRPGCSHACGALLKMQPLFKVGCCKLTLIL